MIKKSQFVIILSVVIFIFGAIYFLDSNNIDSNVEISVKDLSNIDIKINSDQLRRKEISMHAPTADDTLAQSQKLGLVALRESIKNFKPVEVKDAREQVAKNPHNTPTNVLVTAMEMNTIYQNLNDLNSASLFLDKLSDCVRMESDTTIAVKTACVRYVSKIENKFPELQGKTQQILESADSKAKDLDLKAQ